MSALQFFAKNGKEGLSESVFTASNPTPLTGIASKDAPTAFSATAALCTISNTASISAGDNQYVLPTRITMKATAVNTSGAEFSIVGVKDNIERYASGGTALTGVSTSVDTRTDYASRTPKASIAFGEITAAAANSAETVFNKCVKKAICAKGDVIEICFGDTQPSSASHIDSVCVPQVWIGRGSTLVLHELVVTQAADPAFEVTVEWIELGHPRVSA